MSNSHIRIAIAGAGGRMGSRLLLGMHWPRDLVVATLISWALVAGNGGNWALDRPSALRVRVRFSESPTLE